MSRPVSFVYIYIYYTLSLSIYTQIMLQVSEIAQHSKQAAVKPKAVAHRVN